MIRPKELLTAALLFVLSPLASAGVVAVPASLKSPLSVAAVAISGLSAVVPAPASNAVPSLSPSLIPLPAALVPTRGLAAASLPQTPEPLQAARALNNFWDGLGIPALELEEPAAVAVPLAGIADEPLGAGERLAPWLETDDAKIVAAIDRAVSLARDTRAGRRALDAAEKTLAAEGRGLPVLVLDLGRNYGEYDYLRKNMRLHAALFKKGREAELAGTIVHELTHVAQHGLGIPDRKSTRLNSSHIQKSRMPSSA